MTTDNDKTLERIATALEAIALHVKGIEYETGQPQYVLDAIKVIPEVLEEGFASIRHKLNDIDINVGYFADVVEKKK